MTLVRNDQIEGMDRNIQFCGVLIKFLVSSSKDRVPTEEIYRHPLNGADINEGMTGVRVCQIRTRQHPWVKLLFFIEVARLEPLAVDLINLVKFQSRLRLEGGKCQYS